MQKVRDTDLLNKIALRIKALRIEKGLSQEELFAETKIHVARIETAKVNISVSTLSKLCAFFKISLADFFKHIDKK